MRPNGHEPDKRKSTSTSSADSSRFMTNQAFSDQEKRFIQSLLLQATDELQEAQQAEIAPAERARRKAKLIINIFHYKVALAPHKMLPEYILQLIFRWCLPQGEVCVPSAEVEPWFRLTRICSSWRTLAINTPELWRAVAMELRDNHDHEHRIQVAQQWLKRAGNATRSLKIRISEVDEKWCTEAVNRLVLPFRFRSLDLVLARHQFDRILSLPSQFTQSLEKFQFLATTDQPLDSNTELSHSNHKFLHLKTLRMTGIFSASHLMAIFPWAQLRCVFIWGTTVLPASFLNVLADSLALEELRVTIGPDPATFKAPASFTLPNLQRLNLGFKAGSNAEWLLRSLILPKVEAFTVSGPELNCTSLSFANLAQRSGMTQIRSLYLGKGRESYRLDHLLKYTPSLSRITVLGRLEFDGEILEDMSTGRLGPSLEIMELSNVLDVFGILDMVRKRFVNARQGVLVKPVIDIIVPATEVNRDGVYDLHVELNGLGIKLTWLA